jgi:hypothetical protein
MKAWWLAPVVVFACTPIDVGVSIFERGDEDGGSAGMGAGGTPPVEPSGSAGNGEAGGQALGGRADGGNGGLGGENVSSGGGRESDGGDGGDLEGGAGGDLEGGAGGDLEGGAGGAPAITAPSAAVLAWEPCVITALVLVYSNVFVGCEDGAYYQGDLAEAPVWNRRDDLYVHGTYISLPDRTITSLIATERNEGALLMGMVEDVADAQAPVIFNAAYGGIQGWSEPAGVSGSVLGLGVANLPTGQLRVAMTTVGSFHHNTQFSDYYGYSTVGITALAEVGSGTLQGTWVGTPEGKLYHLDAGANPYGQSQWVEITSAKFAAAPVVSISLDPSDGSKVYVSLAADHDALWGSEDGGLSWVELEPPFVSGAVYGQISVNPMFPETLYVTELGSEVRGLRSDDRGKTWSESATWK